MGNCCSSSSAYEDSQPSPHYAKPSKTQHTQKAKVSGPGRTLGEGGGGQPSVVDPRQKAALAAEVRVPGTASHAFPLFKC